MTYDLEIVESLKRTFRKMQKKERHILEAIEDKIGDILEDPYRFKPLMAPMQGYRRVHIMGCFVLLYSIDEKTKTVILHKFAHHDQAYH